MFRWLSAQKVKLEQIERQEKRQVKLPPHPERQSLVDKTTDRKTRPHAYALELGADLFAQHGLTDWRLKLDHARRRAGQCDYSNKTISLSRHYVRYAEQAHIKDTILHEIAHALVGPHHGHDAVWRQKAREIGCTATRCHTLEFSAARWLMSCPNGCFQVERHRRKANMVCMSCKSPVIYEENNHV